MILDRNNPSFLAYRFLSFWNGHLDRYMASFCDRGYLRQFASQCEAALAVARFDRCIGEVTDGAPCYAEQTCSTLEIPVNSIKIPILIILTEHPAMQTCSTFETVLNSIKIPILAILMERPSMQTYYGIPTTNIRYYHKIVKF